MSGTELLAACAILLVVPLMFSRNWRAARKPCSWRLLVALVSAVIGSAVVWIAGFSVVGAALCLPIVQYLLGVGYYRGFEDVIGRKPVDTRLRMFSGSSMPIEDRIGALMLFNLQTWLGLPLFYPWIG